MRRHLWSGRRCLDGKRRHNGRPIGRLEGWLRRSAGGDRRPDRAQAALGGGEGPNCGGEPDAGRAGTGCRAGRSITAGSGCGTVGPALPESVASTPAFAALVVEEPPQATPAQGASIEIMVGEVVIRAGVDAEEAHLGRVIRAVRAAG